MKNNWTDLKAITSRTEGSLDYRDVIYDRAFDKSSQNKLESVRYNAALEIT